jgi:predicted RecA/RadA family phage recombinase
MATNKVGETDVITVAAPANVASGQGVLVGLLFGVAIHAAASGANLAMMTEGVFRLPKATGVAINEGVRVFWDNAAGNVTTTTTSNNCIGWAIGPGNYASGATEILVRLGRPNATAA